MTEKKDNVVPFNKQDGGEQPSFLDSLNDNVKEELKDYEVMTTELSGNINMVVADYAETTEGKRDITLPLQALVASFISTAQTLDFMSMEQGEFPKHAERRVEIVKEITAAITAFHEKNEDTRILQQDIFLALAYALNSYLYQQRVFTFAHNDQEGRRGTHDDQTDNQGFGNNDQETDKETDQ